MRQNREIQNSLYKVCLQNHEQHYHVSECVECGDILSRCFQAFFFLFSKRVKPRSTRVVHRNRRRTLVRTVVLRESKEEKKSEKKKKKKYH